MYFVCALLAACTDASILTTYNLADPSSIQNNWIYSRSGIQTDRSYPLIPLSPSKSHIRLVVEMYDVFIGAFLNLASYTTETIPSDLC